MRTTSLEALQAILALGEGQTVEFKESPLHLEREIVGFANASGGTIFCGVNDRGEIVGTAINNKTLSLIQDVGRNCDPPIRLTLEVVDKKVISISVPEGDEKPYQCSGGFYLRMGANCQKLRTTEVRKLLGLQHCLFDGNINSQAVLEKVLSQTVLERYCKESQIPFPLSSGSLLENLNAAKKPSRKDDQYLLTNAGVLLFTESPKKYLPESYLTVVRYQGDDRFSIADRQELDGDLLQQINDALSFVKRNITVTYEISGDARRVERYEYSLVAIREALINAVTHRDYSFQNSCTYLNIYANRLEIENPGGIYGGISVEDIEGRSVRRNPTLSDLLFRAGYGEKLGSGLLRIKESLAENCNPPYQIASTNFFSIRFLPRIARSQDVKLTSRQLEILSYIRSCKREFSASELALHLGVSTTSISRDMKALLAEKLILRHGTGKLIRYVCS